MPSFARDSRSSTRRLLVAFGLAAIVPAGALVWLGWALVRMDRDREADGRRMVREQAAELAATALQRTLAELEEQVSTFSLGQQAPSASIAQDVALATFDREVLLARAGLPLPFYPAVTRPTPPRSEPLEAADRLEFELRDHAGALQSLRTLIRAADQPTRGEALIRIGRILRKQGDAAGALGAFEQLAALDTAVVSGQPAGLLGAQGRALVLAASGRQADLHRTAADLQQAVVGGQWPLSRAQYALALQQTREWLQSDTADIHDDRAALATIAESVWADWRATASGSASTRSRGTQVALDRSVLVLTRGSADRLTMLLAGPEFLDVHWRAEAREAAGIQDVDLALTDADGRTVVGDPRVPIARQSTRTASVTNLPWVVHAISGPAPGPSVSRQAVYMLSGIGVMLLVVATGGYAITRALSRELRVARLQSDFVAAVSHEFRTPLTTVRQLSELLARGRVSSDARRAEFYDVLLRESDRLHRLVESLLNFARLEAGELEYRFEAVPPGAFFRDLVRDFMQDDRNSDVDIAITGDDGLLPPIRADRELLVRVFWNLLDNAVKYSPAPCRVQVEMHAATGHLTVRVRDRGMGIPAAERQEIFHKFVRGAAARAASIKGTGIGLAMSRQIVAAHGGEIGVESEVGLGSTFTVRLPLAHATAHGVAAETSGAGDTRGRVETALSPPR